MDRKLIIQSLRDKRYTYRSIGKYLGISRQRVHQLLTGYKSPSVLRQQEEWYLKTEQRKISREEKDKIIEIKKRDILKKISTNNNHIKSLCKDISRGLEGREFVREMVRHRDNYTCQICEKVWEKGSRKFDIHHKDCAREKSRQYDNYDKEKKNLITLCHKCHLNLHSIIKSKSG
jgi:predicted transcriptional regulator